MAGCNGTGTATGEIQQSRRSGAVEVARLLELTSTEEYPEALLAVMDDFIADDGILEASDSTADDDKRSRLGLSGAAAAYLELLVA